jgi:predicted RNA polymerase sigma factor
MIASEPLYLVECASMDRAVEIAAKVPEAFLGLVEVRPVTNLAGLASRRGGTAARARAAGAGRTGAAVRRLRRMRGRRAGGAARGVDAVARGRDAGQPEAVFTMDVPATDVPDVDDSPALRFLCCHPELTTSSQVALTLRAVGGLTTPEIARAFLMPEPTVAQRISRAKARINGAGFSMPPPGERAERLSAVPHVLYLIFNEGYTASAGEEPRRVELSAEAIRLTRRLRTRLPDDGEVAGVCSH